MIENNPCASIRKAILGTLRSAPDALTFAALWAHRRAQHWRARDEYEATLAAMVAAGELAEVSLIVPKVVPRGHSRWRYAGRGGCPELVYAVGYEIARGVSP